MPRLDILRRNSGGEKPYLQRFDYTPAEAGETVATALTRLNETLEHPIRWECSCLQKKCGACAMVVNGKPVLACDAALRDDKKTIRIEPLRKFPVVEDLIVDRSILFENLRTMGMWFDHDAEMDENAARLGYEASRCLQCGCCLEVCPNFFPGGTFAGMAVAVPATRLLAELPAAEREAIAKKYRERVYEGCGKSLACRNICPAGINIERMLVHSNAAAVWRRRKKKKAVTEL